MRQLTVLVLLCASLRTGLADCDDATIAHPKTIYVEVRLSGSVVGPPFKAEDIPRAEKIAAELVIQELKRERRILRLPWEFKLAEADDLPRIVIEVNDWTMSVQLEYEEDGQQRTPISFLSHALVTQTEIDAGTYPTHSQRLSFVAEKFIETYVYPNSAMTEINSFAIRPALWEWVPVTEGILAPDPLRITESQVPETDFSLILLSYECYEDFAAEAFIWKCKRKQDAGPGRVTSKSKGLEFAYHYTMIDGTAKQCLVVVHDAFPDPQIVEDRAEVFLSKTQRDPMASSGGFLIAAN